MDEKKTYYTEARAKANAKYLKTLDTIRVRGHNGIKEEYKTAAEEAGKSLNQYILDAVSESIEMGKGSNMYTHEMVELLGEVYNGILKVMNSKGNDPYWTISDRYPMRCFTMLFPRAVSIGIPEVLDAKIKKLMDMIDSGDMEKMINAPMPKEYIIDFNKGMMK